MSKCKTPPFNNKPPPPKLATVSAFPFRLTEHRRAVLAALELDAMPPDLPPLSIRNIADHLKCSASQVHRTMHDLEAAGLVCSTRQKVEPFGGGLPYYERLWQQVDLAEAVAAAREAAAIERNLQAATSGFGFIAATPFEPGEREALLDRALAALINTNHHEVEQQLSAVVKKLEQLA